MLRDLGAVAFDADEIVRGLYEPGQPGAAAAHELFGSAVLDPSGVIDRTRIAEIVFADPAKRHALEARIHPLVREERGRRFREAEASGARVAVAEASQLLEAKSESDYDRVLLVIAPEAERIRRWEQKGGDPEDARRRMQSQLPASTAERRADDVIVNDGSVEDLRTKVETLWRRWIAADQA
jgi:dephospho-CoA kinase